MWVFFYECQSCLPQGKVEEEYTKHEEKRNQRVKRGSGKKKVLGEN